jgi:hypothetical protein
MSAHCINCGTELLAGQRFCRICGAPVSESQREELPTKVFPEQKQAGGARANTSQQQSRPNTDPFYQYQQTTAQPPIPQQQTTPLYMPPDQVPPRGRGKAFIVIGLIGVVLLGAMLLIWAARHHKPVKNSPPVSAPPSEKGIPPVPPPPPVLGDEAGLKTLDEAGAEESNKETVITKTFTLGSGAAFSIKGTGGNVKIEGWDEPRAEVKIIKRGGSIEDRKALRVMYAHDDNQLSFKTSAVGGNGVDLRYEVRLPRALRQVEIKSVNAAVELSDMSGAISVSSQNGSVELNDVSGATTIKLVNGHIQADYEDVKLEGAQQLSAVNGEIEVKLSDETGADVDVKTVSGNIELDGDFGFRVEKKMVGQEASGRVGAGGQALSIKTVNGNIKLSK